METEGRGGVRHSPEDIEGELHQGDRVPGKKVSNHCRYFANFSSQDMPYHVRPDAVFPNNWISVHHSGEVILYPMATPNRWEACPDWSMLMCDGLWLVRRLERRQDLIQWLKDNFEDHKVIDLMRYEDEGKFLEGTGSIVFDYQGEDNKLNLCF